MSNPDDNELIRLRREKLDALRSRGIDPFGGRYPVMHWARGLAERLAEAGEEELKGFGPVSLAGRGGGGGPHRKAGFSALVDPDRRLPVHPAADQPGAACA